MSNKKIIKNKAADNTLSLKQQKKIADEFQKLIQFWTIDNPQAIMGRQKEYMKSSCDVAETTWDRIFDRYKEDEEVNSISQEMTEVFDDYRACIEGIQQWWKYSHIEEV
jgi:hypothetical protein